MLTKRELVDYSYKPWCRRSQLSISNHYSVLISPESSVEIREGSRVGATGGGQAKFQVPYQNHQEYYTSRNYIQLLIYTISIEPYSNNQYIYS